MDDNRSASVTEVSEGVVANVDRLVRGPHGEVLGLELTEIAADRVQVTMPYRAELTTERNVVHGGAIASLIDTAATASVWANEAVPLESRGATISLTVNYLTAARAEPLTAIAQVKRRGRQISTTEVFVRNPMGRDVAIGLVTYKLSSNA